jgi:hypothetical protein
MGNKTIKTIAILYDYNQKLRDGKFEIVKIKNAG